MADDKNREESEKRMDRIIEKGIDQIENKIAIKDRRRAIIVADSKYITHKGRELKQQ